MTGNKKRSSQDAPARIDLVLGSTGKILLAGIKKRARALKTDPDTFVQHVVYDFTKELPAEASALGLGEDDAVQVDSFVVAALPADKASLLEAERHGLLAAVEKGWHKNPGVSSDNAGASGKPRIGLAIANLNDKPLREKLRANFRKAMDYLRHHRAIQEGRKISNVSSRIPVRVIVSAVGATGTGAIHWALDGGVRACAKKAGFEAKVVPYILSGGNLNINKDEDARINELTTKKWLRATGTGAGVNPRTGVIEAVPYDHIREFSNINNHGNIADFERFLAHQTYMDHFLWNTPAGRCMRERSPDVESRKYDAYGDPECICTGSCTCLHRDSERVISYCTHKAAEMLSRSLLAEGERKEVVNDAAALSRAAGIVESEDDNQISRRILQPKQLGEDVCKRAQASLTDRTEGLGGLQKGLALADSIGAVLGDVHTILVPLMQQQAELDSKAAIAALDRRVEQLMRAKDGFWRAKKILELVKLAAERSRRVLTEKAAERQEYVEPHQEIVAEASEQLQQVRNRRWFERIFNSGFLRRVISSLEDSGRALIGHTLEYEACNTAVQYLLDPVLDYLDQRLSWLECEGRKHLAVASACAREAEDAATASTLFEVPLGFELVTREYLDDFYGDYIRQHGGEQRFEAELSALFLKKYGSFSVLTEEPEQNVLCMLIELCRPIFEPLVRSATVLDEFKRLYPDEATQKQMVLQMVLESAGRLQTEGELSKTVHWIKVANVPSGKDAEWAKNMLEGVGNKPGKWQIAVNERDPDTFSIGQLRDGITLTPSIKRLDLPDDAEGWKVLIEKAVDPVSAIMAGPNPTRRQARRIFAKAIACELLTVDKKGRFTLQSSTGDSLLLGSDFESAYEWLCRHFRQSVFIESKFCRDLVVAEPELMARVQQLLEKPKSQEHDPDPRLALIDRAAVDECLTQAELLLPRLERLRKAPL